MVGASLAGLSAARALRAAGLRRAADVVGGERAPPVRPAPAVQGVPGRHHRRARSRAGDRRRGPAAPSGCSACTRRGLDARRLRRAARRRQRRSAPTASSSPPARGRGWPGSEGLAGVHVLRTLDDALALRDELRPGATAGGDRRRIHRRRGRLHRIDLGLDVTVVEAAPTPLAGPLGVNWAPRSPAARRPRRPAAVRGRRRGAERASDRVDRRPAGRRPRHPRRRRRGRHRRRARRRVAARRPGVELANGVVCDAGGAHRRARTWSRSATARPGTTPRVGLATPRRALDRRAGAPGHGRRHAARGRAAQPAVPPSRRTSGPTSTASGSSSPVIAGPGDERHLRGGRLRRRAASWPSTGARAIRSPCSGMNQPRLFTRWRRQADLPSRSRA